jgi:hypothetical protein
VNEKNKDASIGPTVKIMNPRIQGVMKAYAQSESRRARLKRGGLKDDCIIVSFENFVQGLGITSLFACDTQN